MDLKHRKHFFYWILPLIVIVGLIFANYSGIELLQTITSPKINREFGIIENLQLLVILGIITTVFSAFKKSTHWLETTAISLLFIFFIIAFLEEIDYGIHYYEYFFKDGIEDKSHIRNIHNQPGHNHFIRQVMYVFYISFFVALPLVKYITKNKYLRYISAETMIISTFAVYVIAGQLARKLPRLGFEVNESLRNNHQEFEELIAYYMILLFMYEIIRHKVNPFLKADKTPS